MLKKYFTTSFRHLWRFRLFTGLNILGLSVSISACWIIFQIVNYEFSYDRGLSNKSDIYRVVSGFIFDEKKSYNGGVAAPLYQGIRSEIEGLDEVVPVLGRSLASVEILNPSGKSTSFESPEQIAATDYSYFKLVNYRWLSGNKKTALSAPGSIVLSESRARKYFPGKKPEEIINRTLIYYGSGDTLTKTVTGIVADLKSPTDFTTQEFFSLPTAAYSLASWTNTNGSDKLYLQFKSPVTPEKLTAQIMALSARKMTEFEKQSNNHFEFKRWFQLVPVSGYHFSTFIEEYNVRKASKPVMYGLISIALFLLLLACINYINMSVARIPQRAVEIGVRKTLGSSHSQLIGQFLAETILTTAMAAVLSFSLSFFGFWLLSDIIPEGVTPMSSLLELGGFILLVVIAVTILAGIYPGWLITRVKTISVFRHAAFPGQGSNRFSLQKALIVFQFFIALLFITSSLIVGRQLRYTLSTDLGFNKDAVLLVQVPWKYLFDKEYENKQFILFNELKKERGIQNISLGETPMEDNYSSSLYDYFPEGKSRISRNIFKKYVDTAYMSLYDIKLLAGRKLRASDTTNEFVVNETAVRAFGFASPQAALGKLIGQKNDMHPVVGVVKDFHLQNFYKTIDPVALLSEKASLHTFNIKLQSHNGSGWQAAIKSIEHKWNQFYPAGSFAYKFYDESLEGMYVQERHLAKLVNLATIITILISCLGLFGLAVLTAFQRTREIGIRKVLGASVSGIVQLLSKEYVRLVIIALVIATPVGWWAMDKWLQDFAYRIQIKWWIFLLAGAIGILIALITVSLQAFKAARANPVKSLRSE